MSEKNVCNAHFLIEQHLRESNVVRDQVTTNKTNLDQLKNWSDKLDDKFSDFKKEFETKFSDFESKIFEKISKKEGRVLLYNIATIFISAIVIAIISKTIH